MDVRNGKNVMKLVIYGHYFFYSVKENRNGCQQTVDVLYSQTSIFTTIIVQATSKIETAGDLLID